MKLKVLFLSTIMVTVSLCGCANSYNSEESTSASKSEYTVSSKNDSSDYSLNSNNNYSDDNDDNDDTYDYDKGYGYTAPKEGQSFSDYVKEQDPELYNSITNQYDDAVNNEY